MTRFSAKIALPALLFAAVAFCAVLMQGIPGSPQPRGASQGEPLLVWAHSDIQPRNENEKRTYEAAVRDMRDLNPRPGMALFAGDIVQFSNFRPVFTWFLKTRAAAGIPEWYEIAGNHEWRAIEMYKRLVRSDLHYSVRKGNVLFIFMSNERYGRRTFISDGTFRWWENLVRANQDKIIVTVTHGTLEGNGLTAANLERLCITDSRRFRDVLRHQKVDIWISGHSHFPGWLPRMHHRNEYLGGTVFIDLGAVRLDLLATSESRMLEFRPGSDTAILRYRDHVNRAWFGQYGIHLSRPYIPSDNNHTH